MIQLTQAHILGAIIAYLLGIFIVPIVIFYSDKKGLVDVPNERKIHKGKISRLGGIAIWLAVMLTFLFLVLLSYYPKGQGLSGIIVGGSLMFLLGLIDDIYGLSAKFKLLIQTLIATTVILLGVKIDVIYNPFGDNIELFGFSYPISLLWIVGISNAINFIDGVDGLAGSVVTISSIAIAIVSIAMTPSSPISALVAIILLGAMLAFLTFNYNPAKIFMGDSGALFAGFILSTLSITGIMNNDASPLMYLPFLILLIPIADITYSSLRRISKGKSPFSPDCEHIHHKLLHHGFSQDFAVLILSSISMLCAAISILITGVFDKYFIFAIVALIFILFGLNVVSKTIKKKS